MPTISEVRDEKVTHWYAYGKNKRSQAWSPIHDVERGLKEPGTRDPHYLSEAEADDAAYEWLQSKGRSRSAYEVKTEHADKSTDRASEIRVAEWHVQDQEKDCLRELAKLQARYEQYAQDVARLLTAWAAPVTNDSTEDQRLDWLARHTEEAADSAVSFPSNAHPTWLIREARELRMALMRREMVYSKYDPDPVPEPEAASATTD